MTPGVLTRSEVAARRRELRRTDRWLLVSGACLALEIVLTDSGPMERGTAAFYLVVGLALLALVRRGNAVARGVIVVTSSVGAIIHALSAHSFTGVALTLLFAGQAAALLTPAVRNHVQSRASRT